MLNLAYRLHQILPPRDRLAVLVDASAGVELGVLPGLEDFPAAVNPLLPMLDGLVCSPGHLGKVGLSNRSAASLLARMDWNNTRRGPGFILPCAIPHYVPLLSAQDALHLGAVGMVSTFLLGYAEELEAACLVNTVRLALEGKTLGLPLLVEVQATGERIALPGKAVELGASYALEGGADAIIIPYPGPDSLATLARFVSLPWLLKPSRLESALDELQQALDAGASGLWLDHALFADPDPLALLRAVRSSRPSGLQTN